MDKFNNNLFKHFRWYDYLVVSGVLFIGSTVIGLMYMCQASNQDRREERRKHAHTPSGQGDESSSAASDSFGTPPVKDANGKLLSPFVVAFALFSSVVSGSLILTNTGQIFRYGIQSVLAIITFVFIGLSLSYFYLPVYYNLQLSSAFEYLQTRFSRTTRVVVSLLAILQSTLLLTEVTYETANGFGLIMKPELNKIILCGVLLFIASFSCLIGGLKSMLCTNIFYSVVIIGTLITVTVLGVLQLDGVEAIWEKNLNTNRIDILKIDPDLRNPNTLWTCLFSQYFLYAAFLVSTNCTAQRLISLKTVCQARISLLLFVIIASILIVICSMIGLLISAKYFDCNPFSGDANEEFIFPTFVVQMYSEFPCVYGLWLAIVVCATISVLSNILHGLGMAIICDYVQHYFQDMGETLLHILLKIFIFMFGCIIFGVILFLDLYSDFLPVVDGIFLTLIGTVFGVFTLGMFFPWANSKGSLLGVLTTLCTMSALIWGAQDFRMEGGLTPNYELPISSNSCQPYDHGVKSLLESAKTERDESELNQALSNISQSNTNISPLSPISFVISNATFSTLQLPNESQNSMSESENPKTDLTNYVILISRAWYPTLSFLITVLSGLLFSILNLRWIKKWKVAQECLSPPMLSLWFKLFPAHMKSWIEPDDDLLFLCSNAFPYTPKEKRKRKNCKDESWCEVHIQRVR